MAFTQYKVGPRRVVIAGTYEVEGSDGIIRPVMLADSAVEDDGVDGCDWKAYQDSLYDETKLRFKEDGKPTWLHIKALTTRQKQHIEDLTLNKKLRMAFRFGVTQVEGYIICRPDGSDPQELPDVKVGGYSNMGSAVTEGWMSTHNLATDFIQAAGLMVLQISEATAPLSRASDQQSGAE